ncbi:MAG: thiamine phosphate synthase [Planctomycetales bacterium]
MNRLPMTPGARRSIAAASHWIASPPADQLGSVEMLLGLLMESESRAAQTLAARGIDRPKVLDRWPEFSQSPDESSIPRRLSSSLEDAFEQVNERLWAHPRPLELGTEHLLLGLLFMHNEVASWLRQQGLDADQLETDANRVHGYDPTPLEMDWDDDSINAVDPSKDADSINAVDPSNTDISADSVDSGNAVEQINVSPQQGAIARDFRPTENEANCSSESSPDGATEPRTSPSSLSPESRPASDLASPEAIRIFDASANRAREALRVIEDYARFGLDDVFLTGELKQTRHDLEQAVGCVPLSDRLACRETLGDVGTGLTTSRETRRENVEAVLAANFHRLGESLRSLEEYGKTLAPRAAETLEKLRYRSYTLQRAVDVVRRNRDRLRDVRLYVLVGGGDSAEAFQTLIRGLVAVGVHAIQLRDKRLTDRVLLDRARLLRRLTADSATLFIMNDRPDLAVLSDADGVHVGQEELTVKDARAVVGPRRLIGVSTHSIEQARQAVLDGADYLGTGPTFPSPTKQFKTFAGLEFLRLVNREIRLPSFAIGGLNETNCGEVFSAGATRVAVSSAIESADSPAQAASRWLRLLRAADSATKED